MRSTRWRSPAPVVKDGVERFPVAYLNEEAMEIRLLLDHRNDLVAERTRTVNRLRWHLLELCPELEGSLKRGALNQARVLERVDRRLRKLPAGARVRITREQIARLRGLNRRIDALQHELAELVKAHCPRLLAEMGCRPVVAAILIGRTAGHERFRSDASFALQSGTAPIPCSSGQRTQHRAQPRRGPPAQPRAARDRDHPRAARPRYQGVPRPQGSRGEDSKGALRCLKRHLARRFPHLLSLPAELPQRDPSNGADPHAATPPRGDRSTAGAAPALTPRVS